MVRRRVKVCEQSCIRVRVDRRFVDFFAPEARFLLPAILPVLSIASYELARLYDAEIPVAVKDKDTNKTTRWWRAEILLFWLIWLAFNASITIFYGFAHQARISSAVLDLSDFAADPDGVRFGNYSSKALVTFLRDVLHQTPCSGNFDENSRHQRKRSRKRETFR